MIWILIVILLILFYGIFIEPHLMRVKTIGYSRSQHLKLAHFSDTHFTWHTSARRFQKFVKNIAQNQPDVILFTGDLFDKVSWAKKKDLTSFEQILTDLSAPLGKFAILGNHDFDEQNASFVRQVLEKSGFTVLTNQSTLTANLSLTGTDDLREGQPDFAVLPVSSATFSLLMIHEPDTILQMTNLEKFDLVIAGHSHGGQIRLGNLRLRNKGSKYFDSGSYKISEKTLLYVNNGIGLTFLPIRIGVPPELTYYEL